MAETNLSFILGDLDNDQKISAKDALEILKYTVGKTQFVFLQEIIGDVNNDGNINAKDALEILKYSVGKASVLDKVMEPTHTHSYSNATCTEPPRCSCGETNGSALGHSYSEKSVEPTCTESGYIMYICENCGDTFTLYDREALGHNWNVEEVQVIPTYTQPGEYKGVCLRCNKQDCFSLGCLIPTSNQIKEEMLRLINIEREKAGLKALTYYEGAQIAVDARAQELHILFSHTRPNGYSCFSALNDYNISSGFTLGENIALGYPSVEDVMIGWMNSPGHRDNILDSDFKRVAIGEYENGWVQMFFG